MARVLHIVAGLPEEGGGVATFVVELAATQAAQGHEVAIATRSDVPPSAIAREAEARGVRVHAFRPSFPGAVFFSWRMLVGLRRLVCGADVVHVHCDWTFPVWWGCRCALRERRTLAMSPHGSFDPVRLAHSAWKKRLVGWLDRRFLRRADLVHATSGAEAGWMRAALGDAPRIVVAPPGVSPPPDGIAPPSERPGCRTLLCFGRIHPLKGLDMLLEALARVRKGAVRLVVSGPDEEGERARLEALARKLGVGDAVEFWEAVAPQRKWGLFAGCDAVVLPSRSENFGIVVAEALAAGRPAICTKAAPWEALERERCGWWCDTSAQGLRAALEDFLSVPGAELAEMGRRGRAYAMANLRWEQTAADLLAAYHGAAIGKEGR